MIDLNDIALYVQVVRSGSFAEAARRLGTAPNSVSRRVQQLEAQLDTRLMQRSTRKLTLTDAGQAFYERCGDAVDGLTDAGQSLVAGGEEVAGLVRVAAPADFLDFFRVEWVADFLAAHPRVRLEFLLSDARADLIAERIDVAFRAGIWPTPVTWGGRSWPTTAMCWWRAQVICRHVAGRCAWMSCRSTIAWAFRIPAGTSAGRW